MHGRSHPAEAYRRIALDARIAGSSGLELVRLCLGEALAGLARALWAEDAGHHGQRGQALRQAQAALAALRLGVDPQSPLGPALLTLYDAALAAVGRAITRFDPQVIRRVQADLAELREAFHSA